jgi:5,10-methylenetetrahydromethanopterin reductase
MKLGISLWLDSPLPGAVDLAVAAERAGMHDVWLPDHYFLRDVYVAQALMATATERVHFGTGVAAAQLRLPAQLAASAATIDELAPGRVIVGIGPGGYEFASQFALNPRSPITLMREAVLIVRQLLAGGAQVTGEYFTATNAKLGWSAPSLPVFLAARGPRMLELAGELADGVIVHGLSPAFIEYVRSHLARGAARAGRSADACEIMIMLDVDIDDDVAAARDRLRHRCTIMAGGAYSDDLIPVYGLDPDDVARLRVRVRASDPRAGDSVTDEMVDAFAIAGDDAHVEARLARLAELGIGRAVMKLGEGSANTTHALLERIQPTVARIQRVAAASTGG